MLLRIFLAAALAWPALAAAESERPTYTPPTVLSAGSILQVIFSLMLVLAAVALIAWVLKRINQPLQGAGQLKVVSGVAVGQRERVVVVEVGDTWLVLGVAQGNVRTLHTLPKGEIPTTPRADDGGDGKFQAWLKQVMEKRNAA